MPNKKPKVLTYQQAYDLALKAGSRFPSVVAAQFAIETDWGRRTAKANNNLFNIKYHEGAAKRLRDRGIKVTKAKEAAKDNQTGSVDYYMEFESVEDAFIGYQNFIESNPRYSKALKAKNAQDYLQGIWEAGYAEDKKYVGIISSLARGAGHDPKNEDAFSDEAIAEIRGTDPKDDAVDDIVKPKDNLPKERTINTPRNRSSIMRNIDWSQSTINDRQFDRMEKFVGSNIEGNDTRAAQTPEEDVAKAAVSKTDLESLESEEVQTEIPAYTPPPEAPETEEAQWQGDIKQHKQYEGGVQPNGRKSNFTREEDLQAQGNTYNPLNLF